MNRSLARIAGEGLRRILLAPPHDALAHGETTVSNKTTSSVPVKTRKATLLVMNFSSSAGSAGRDER